MPQGFFFYVGVAIKKDYNLGLLPVGYFENCLSSLIQAEDMEWDFIRNNQDISQNLKILAFSIPSLLDCSAVNSVAQRCQVFRGTGQCQKVSPRVAKSYSKIMSLFLPRLLFSSLLFKVLADAVSERCFFQLNLTRESKEHLCFFTTAVQGSFMRLMLH